MAVLSGADDGGMQTTVDEIAPDIFRLSTWVPDITEHGFTFNQFLLTGDEPFLFHCGQRQLFPLVSQAINRVLPVEKLRWISFGHLEPDAVRDIGGHRLRFMPTPHVPHNWEAGLWFDEATSTLLAGDLFTHVGMCPPLTESDCVTPALEAESIFHGTGLTTALEPTLNQLADLNPKTLAIMHGSSFSGDGGAALRALADGYAAMAV